MELCDWATSLVVSYLEKTPINPASLWVEVRCARRSPLPFDGKVWGELMAGFYVIDECIVHVDGEPHRCALLYESNTTLIIQLDGCTITLPRPKLLSPLYTKVFI
jgi:hypothetical protein